MTKPGEKRILVVDDEEDVAFFLTTALEDAGFQVETASSVDDALEKIRARPPHCVSLDMMMPGKSGIVLFHEMHKNPAWAKIPVLFVTAHGREEGVRKELDAASALAQSTLSGPTTYLEKPVTAVKYLQAVASSVGVVLQGETAKEEEGQGLRTQVAELLQGADPDALKAALELLKRRSDK
jgi:CheY-like chemotaxis protein